MRLLLDEGFPSPPGFRPETVDATVEVVALRHFAPALTGASTPDKSTEKPTGMLGQLASDLGISTQQVRDQAREVIEQELATMGQLERFHDQLT